MRRLEILLLVFLSLSLTVLSSAASPAAPQIPVTADGDGGAGDHLIAGAPGTELSLTAFSKRLPRSDQATPVGVYVSGVLALEVLTQPASSPGYVTSKEGAVSLFRLAQQHGTTGLIAHNYLSGQHFFELSEGQQVIIIMSDGSRNRYRINSTRRFKALSPWSPISDFAELDQDGSLLTARQLFNQMYSGDDRVVFQTCIEAQGNLVWGRLFVTAEPIDVAHQINWAAKMMQLKLVPNTTFNRNL